MKDRWGATGDSTRASERAETVTLLHTSDAQAICDGVASNAIRLLRVASAVLRCSNGEDPGPGYSLRSPPGRLLLPGGLGAHRHRLSPFFAAPAQLPGPRSRTTNDGSSDAA